MENKIKLPNSAKIIFIPAIIRTVRKFSPMILQIKENEKEELTATFFDTNHALEPFGQTISEYSLDALLEHVKNSRCGLDLSRKNETWKLDGKYNLLIAQWIESEPKPVDLNPKTNPFMQNVIDAKTDHETLQELIRIIPSTNDYLEKAPA